MQASQFSIEKSKRRPNGLSANGKQRPVLYAYLDSPAAEGAATPGYDNLLEYWHLLAQHKMTLLAFGVCGLVAAILFSFIQTPTYRVRTSLEIQSTNFVEIKGGDPSGSTASIASPESYVETQGRRLKSETLVAGASDNIKDRKKQQTNG